MKRTQALSRKYLGAICAVALVLIGVCSADAGLSAQTGDDLTQLSIEDLMNIQVTSVSKKTQYLADAPAAVFVLTADDIRRSGATTIADALRMVPGLQVAKIDANKWAVTSRGFNGRFANKLLVLMDGRSVYTPWFSGVFWETLDTVLEDLDRIEVIRGPGASLWGSNAVNGVINIITKNALDTQGGLLTGLVGTEERGTAVLRYGAKLGGKTPFRVYGKYINRDSGVYADGRDAADDWHFLSGGFRLDSRLSNRDILLFEGGIFQGETGTEIRFPTLNAPYEQTRDVDDDHCGHHLLTRWQRAFSEASDLALQLYYDHETRFPAITHASTDTYDLDFQHRFNADERHEIVWGLGYRYIRDHIDNNPGLITIDPGRRTMSIFNAFIQDDIGFFDGRWHLTIGSKFEYNDYTHLGIQPTARILWKLAPDHTLWAAASRALRTPSRGERDSRTTVAVLPPGSVSDSPLPVAVDTFGSQNFEEESLNAYEMGYRFRAGRVYSMDLSIYYNQYRDLRDIVQGQPFVESSPQHPHLVMPFTLENRISGSLYGLELAADWRPTGRCRFQLAYAYTLPDLDGKTVGSPSPGFDVENPRHQVSVRAGFDLPKDVALDLWWQYVDNLGSLVDAYHTLSVRLGWEPVSNLEIALVGQNLIESQHQEFIPEFFPTVSSEVQRGVYFKVSWKF